MTWYADDAINVPAYRAYLTYTEPACKSFSLCILDEEGKVDQVINTTPAELQGACYNLNGQRLQKPQHGVNIIGGKLILKK